MATNQTSASIHPTNTSHHPAAGTFAGEVVGNVTYPIAETVENTHESAAETAAEIAELLYNNPRLVSPCIDVPLASVQVVLMMRWC